MNEQNDYKILELDYPHGFLIWRGKQTAIGTPESLPVGEKLLIVSEDEAFGYVTLKAPAQMKASEFDREEYHKEHRLDPTEWRLSWPDVKALNLYRFESWGPFEKALPFENGEIIDDQPTPHEAALIDKSRYLPKTLVLDDEAITMTGGKFTIAAGLAIPDDLKQILQTTYETEVEFVANKQSKYLPLYRLALVRVPNMRVKKNEGKPVSGAEATGDGQVKVQQDTPAVTASVKQEMHMPWEKVRDHPDCPSDEPVAVVKTDTGEVEGCHANEEDANAQLAALNASEEGESAVDAPIESGDKQESLQQRLSRISQQFHDTFADTGEVEGCCDHDLWVVDVFDAFIVANDSGDLFRVNYMDTEAGVIFAPMDTWVAVEIGYNPKGFTLLARNEPPKKERNWKDKLREAARTITDFLQGADYSLQQGGLASEDEPEKMFTAPSGILIKEVNGEPWHVLWSTNAFEDREGEIFATEALKTYVRENAENEDKGAFDLWHMPGTDFADKKFQAVIGRILLEAGPYKKDETGQAAMEFFKKHPKRHPVFAPEGWGASPAFRFLPEDRLDNIYDWLWITKTSTLPRAAAANVWTKATQENIMTEILPQMKELGVAIWGEEGFQKRIEEGEAETKRLEKYLAHKAKEDSKTNKAESPEESEEQATETAQVEGELEETEVEEETEGSDDGEAVPVINVNVEELAAEVKKQFEFDLQPVAEAMAEILKEVKAVSDRVTKLEKHEAVKEQVETPRFLLNLVRASEAEETALAEDDKLKEKKPQEAKVKSDGTLMGNFFPGPK